MLHDNAGAADQKGKALCGAVQDRRLGTVDIQNGVGYTEPGQGSHHVLDSPYSHLGPLVIAQDGAKMRVDHVRICCRH